MSQPILTRNLTAISITSGTTTSSSLIDISDCTVIAFQAIWAGTTPSGTVTIEGSLNGTTWSTFGASSITVTGASGNGLVNFNPAGMPFIRATYTHTSGTVTSLQVLVSTKQPS
jgi:hypothetical protein